jgi:hypothetical protein
MNKSKRLLFLKEKRRLYTLACTYSLTYPFSFTRTYTCTYTYTQLMGENGFNGKDLRGGNDT